MADSLNIREPIVPSMDLFGAISDEMRLKILLLLDQAEFTVNEIKDILDIHQSNASRHLAKLSSCNLLKDRRDGIKAYYRLSEDLYMSGRMLTMIREAYEELPDKDILKCRAAQVLEDRTDKTKGQIHKLDQAGGSLKAQISLFGHLMYPFENAVDVGCGEGGDAVQIVLAGNAFPAGITLTLPATLDEVYIHDGLDDVGEWKYPYTSNSTTVIFPSFRI